LDMKLELNEEIGEILCPKCQGKSGTVSGEPSDVVVDPAWVRCNKCQGTGKLDWCQQAVGVAPPKYYGFDSSASMSLQDFAQNVYVSTPQGDNAFYKMYMNLIENMSNDLAEKIDNEILATLTEDLEQNDDEKNVIGGSKYDHRVFSELMFFPSS